MEGDAKMVVIYPESFICPNCKGNLQLDYSKDRAQTDDLMVMRVEMPLSNRSGKDARKNKEVDKDDYDVIFCTKCRVILGFSWNAAFRLVKAR